MMQGAPLKAVIYCRVSDPKQTTRGDGLSSQETRLREFATSRGYLVEEVYKDNISGALADRPGINAMIAYLRKNRASGVIVLIDDISRLARDIITHRKFRAIISKAGAILMSPTQVFVDDDPDMEFAEGINALQAEHQRKKNQTQTKNRMRGRALNGFWVFQAPWGFTYGRAPGGGKMLFRQEPLASIIQEAFESFASGRLSSIGEVKRFFEAQPGFPRCQYDFVLHERVRQILTQPIYAGYIEIPRWDIPLRKGQHVGLVSLEAFEKVQDLLREKPRAPARVDITADFPLRGFITCDDCGHSLTANWSKGELKSYPYYLCRQRGCESNGKSVARAKVEGAFEELLKSLTPARELFDLASAMFRDLWDAQVATSADQKKTLKAELSEIERRINQYLDRIVEAESKTVVAAFEKRIDELDRQKLLVAEKIEKFGKPLRGYDESFRTAMSFLASPWNLWRSGKLEDQRATLKLAFPDELRYSRKEGFRTPKTSIPFNILSDVFPLVGEMARPERFERPTLRFVGSCQPLFCQAFVANWALWRALKYNGFLDALQT